MGGVAPPAAAPPTRTRVDYPSLIARPRLEQRLDEAFGRRLALVVGGAGFGKSTLLDAWTSDLVAVWLQASSQDRTLSSFSARLADALHPQASDLSGELTAGIAGATDDLAVAERLAGLFCATLGDSASSDVVLVLDDAHELAASPACLRLIEGIARHAPPTLHLVLASREELELQIERLRGQGQILEIGAAELAFTAEEVEQLTTESLGEDGGVSARIHAATLGWPAAVRLVVEVLRPLDPGKRELALAELRQAGSPLFSYLAHEVFAGAPPDVTALIRSVSPFERFTLDLCKAVAFSEAETATAWLAKRGLFLEAREGWLSLHALVRDFARASWPLDPDEERRINQLGAKWFEQRGRPIDALHAFDAAERNEEVARVLECHGPSLLAAGASDVVARFVTKLPTAHRTPALDQLLGDALFGREEYEAAFEAFERATGAQERIDSALAWRMMRAHYLRSDLQAVLSVLSRARTDGRRGADEAMVQSWASSTHCRLGNRELADELADAALDLARKSGDDSALATAHAGAAMVAELQHEGKDAEAHLRSALAAARRAGDTFQLVRIHINSGVFLLNRGQYGAALADLDEAVRLTDSVGVGDAPHSLLNRGGAYLRMGLLDAAGRDYEAAREMLSRAGRFDGAARLGLGNVHRERGDLALARAAYERVVSDAEKVGDMQVVAATLHRLAQVLVDDEPERAARLAERSAGLRFSDEAAALTSAGWIALARGEAAKAAAHSRLAGGLAQARGDPSALAEALELGVFASEDPKQHLGQLREALAIWRELGSRIRIATAELALARLSPGAEAHAAAGRAEQRLRSLGVRLGATGSAGLLRTVARPPAVPVAIRTLGGFSLIRDGIPVSRAEWQSKKARDLLKILVARRGRATPRDLLVEALWAGEDPGKLGNRLSVALSTLRAVLDPDKRFDPEHFVKADWEGVALQLDSVVVDVDVFLHEAESGLSLRSSGLTEAAAERLEQAETAYAGDFLDEDPYADWAIPLREESRAAYIGVAHALAGDAAARGDHDSAARYFLRILGRDSYDETAHLGLVSTLQASGRHGEARRAYRSYVARMEEIGAAPALFPSG
jgi:DNA-binding SARP family transcriptional activator/Tfp pilus assembly protein PilF